LLVALTGNTAWALSENEAGALGTGIRNVARHYPMIANASGKWMDWSNLMIVAAVIYGSKSMATNPAAPPAPLAMPASAPHATPPAAPKQPPPPPAPAPAPMALGLPEVRAAGHPMQLTLNGVDLHAVEIPPEGPLQ
jgi:hypothetical protein